MGTIECSPASKSSWDNQVFGDISMVLKMAHFRKSTWPRWVKYVSALFKWTYIIVTLIYVILWHVMFRKITIEYSAI